MSNEKKEETNLMDQLEIYKTVLVRGFVTGYHENLSSVEIHFGEIGFNPYRRRLDFDKEELKKIVEDVRDFEKENVMREIAREVEEDKRYDFDNKIEELKIFLKEEYQESLNRARSIWGWDKVGTMLKSKDDVLMKFIIKTMKDINKTMILLGENYD